MPVALRFSVLAFTEGAGRQQAFSITRDPDFFV